MIKEIKTVEEFKESIKEEKVLVDFYAVWCGPCRAMSPVVDEIAEEENITLLKVNVDNFPELCNEFNIQFIPRFFVFKNGDVIKSFQGMTDKEEIVKALN